MLPTVTHGQWVLALTLASVVVVLGGGALVAWLRHVVRTGQWSWRRDDEEVIVETAAAKVCSSCARRYGEDALFCAADGAPLSWLEGEIGEVAQCCRRCNAVYGAGMRFCPIDAEELVRLELGDADDHHHVEVRVGSDMICPVCAARYEVALRFCGRDGTRLCPLH